MLTLSFLKAGVHPQNWKRMRKMNTPRTCDFCGRSAPEVSLSKEHVFARSLRDTVRNAEDHTYASATDKSGRLKGGESVRRVAMFDVTSRRVCGECNSGWMSELEVSANPVLRRLIAGETTLTGAEVDVVRRWLVKTAVVAHMAEPNSEKPEPTVDPSDRRTVMDQIPVGWVVTLAVLHPSWRNHTHRGSVALPKMRMVDGVEISEGFHFATIEIGCMPAPTVAAAAGPTMTPPIRNAMATSRIKVRW